MRLRQGRMEKETVYSLSPGQVAARWKGAGAEWIHVVDLDGAVAGYPVNIEAVKEIRAAVDIPLQLGGGIRRASRHGSPLGSSGSSWALSQLKTPQWSKRHATDTPIG